MIAAAGVSTGNNEAMQAHADITTLHTIKKG